MERKEIIKKMTLIEKSVLFSGKTNWETKAIDRLNIPSVFCADGPHGVRKQVAASDHLGLNPSETSTCFPTAAAVVNSWDIKLGELVGEAIGKEASALDVNVLLGPGLNIKRNPRCGRNFEYFSEDPYLAGKMAASYIRGIQGQGVAACPKHFAVNNQETMRMANDSVVDERALREIYLTAFEIAVKEGKPWTLMTSYNKVNGIYANENKHLLRDILVDEWGFDGIVISDWGGSNNHVEGVRNGAHLEMPASGWGSDLKIVDAVKSGDLSEEILEQRVDEYLSVIFKLREKKQKIRRIPFDRHHKLARKIAAESIVLLKNDNQILPLKEKIQVGLIGDFAETPRYQGAGSSLVNAYQVESTRVLIEEENYKVFGYEKGFVRTGETDNKLLQRAVSLAREVEVVLLYLGLDELRETEGVDRGDIFLSQNQVDVLKKIHEVNENIVVVLSGGAVVDMSWRPFCKAIIHASLSGEAGAGAILDVIGGRVNPSGKLAETYPVAYSDVPSSATYPGFEVSSEYRESIYVGYRYYEKADMPVLYPFGYGMSYTTFEYSGLEVTDKAVSFNLRNTGGIAGAEVVQLYVGRKKSEIFRAKKELKGFDKIFLEPDESKTVVISFDDKTFRYFNAKKNCFEIEDGEYELYVAASSEEIRLKGNIVVSGIKGEETYGAKELPNYFRANIKKIPDDEFETLLGYKRPPSDWNREKEFGRNDTFMQLQYSKSLIGRLIYLILNGMKKKADKKGKPDLNILFIQNMPFRAIGKMTAGAVDMKMVDAIVFIFNGHFFRGTGRLISAFFQKGKAEKMMKKALEGSHE